ncbi:MAG: hypothetical protein AAGK78_04105 [Planctomycetota bacterium]
MRTDALALLTTVGLALACGCTPSMDKPSMDEQITVDPALDAVRRLTGGRVTLLAPPQQAQQTRPAESAATNDDTPDSSTRANEFPDGLAPAPRPARRKREP